MLTREQQMIRKELLPARQVAKHAPWTIKREDLERPEIRNYVQVAYDSAYELLKAGRKGISSRAFWKNLRELQFQTG